MPTIPLGDARLYYEKHGSGPPLVLLHGGWQNIGSWGRQIERFASDFRVVAYDLRGHGRTGPTEADHYSIDRFVDDLERLLSALGIEQPLFCGVSVGGMVLQSYLDRHPDGARGAVIGAPLQSMPPIDIPVGMKALASPLPAIDGMVSTVGPRATFQSLLNAVRATTGKPWLATDPAVRSRAKTAAGEVSPAEFRKIFRALYEFVPPDLSGVDVPLLVLAGENEVPAGKRQGERLAETVVNGAYREIPGAGHLVNEDSPAAFNDACARFFAGLEPVGRGVPSA